MVIKMDKLIYMDNAATTQMNDKVLAAMMPYFSEYYGNPSSVYTFAGKAKKAVDLARAALASGIGASPEEIYFTSGGSESDNWALKAAAEAYKDKGNHIITSRIEHHAVLHTAGYLEKKGYKVTYLNVDKSGMINPEELKSAIRPDTILVSIMAANNEIGTIEPLEQIGAIAKERKVLFHTDAVQAFGHIPIDVNKMHIDMLSASAHKLGGPKGAGLLYVRKGVKINSFIHGGAQERQRRAGTLNVPGIVGFGKAAELAFADMDKRSGYESELRDYMIDRILTEIPYSCLNGGKNNRLPNNTGFCFRFIEGETLLILLDQNGICASSGSACASGALEPSHVLTAIGLPEEIARGSLRLTISERTTREEVDFTVDKIKEIVERLRNMSATYEDFIKKQQK